jgi:hypothetical protein
MDSTKLSSAVQVKSHGGADLRPSTHATMKMIQLAEVGPVGRAVGLPSRGIIQSTLQRCSQNSWTPMSLENTTFQGLLQLVICIHQ